MLFALFSNDREGLKKIILFLFVFLQEYSHRIGDNKRLSEYLKLPIQRINDFQVLLQVIHQEPV